PRASALSPCPTLSRSQSIWSNYFEFVADHPDYPFPFRGPDPKSSSEFYDAFAFNTPNQTPQIHAHMSSPVMYTTPAMFRWMQTDHVYHFGSSFSAVSRALGRARIDACVNAHHALPLAPWF